MDQLKASDALVGIAVSYFIDNIYQVVLSEPSKLRTWMLVKM